MDPTMLKLRSHISSIQAYLTPLLPLANCHMVEFLTQNHWETLLPRSLRETLDGMEMEQAVEMFWSSCENEVCDIAQPFPAPNKSALSEWIHTARSHCLAVNNEYCLSVEQLEDRIRSWGGTIPPEIKVNQFMSSKKSYEVCKTVGLVGALAGAARAALVLEAGGGRGALGAAASLGLGLPSLSVDCDPRTLAGAERRARLMQKQWHAIATQGEGARASAAAHRFARRFVTGHTDLAALAADHFPELPAARLLLTGLHTCGNLGPSSLRIFSRQAAAAALASVPCCYHLLAEQRAGAPDVFQRDYGGPPAELGFPMSDHLRGFALGRNARMLAAQSAQRAAAQRRLPARGLLYRAKLQEIVKKHKPDLVLAEGRLKRVSAKTQDFEQYFKMADSILNLELFDSLPASYFTNVDCHWKNMVMFYLIRMCLAQVVETLILLDRLLFLRENGFNNVFLVKLFDPVLSPRCHGIVGVR